MADKEFKNLNRGELIEVIYEMKKNELRLRSELEAANAELNRKNLKIKEAGSIAEAVASLNNLFEVAQKTADDYLEQIYAVHAGIEERCRLMEEETKKKCAQKEQETDRLIAEKWKIFRQKVQEYAVKVQAYAKSQVSGARNANASAGVNANANANANLNANANRNANANVNVNVNANRNANANANANRNVNVNAGGAGRR